MFEILSLNKISNCIYEALTADKFTVSDTHANPDAILVRSADVHGMELGSDLLAVARAGAGYNNIPVGKMTEQYTVVFNTPGANSNGVQELVIAGMIMISRNVHHAVNWTRSIAGEGDKIPALVEKGKGQFVGPELRGKTLGVVGLGAVGSMVANSARGLGMEVIGYDPFISVDQAWSLSRSIHRASNIETMLPQCDYVSIHIPLHESTRGLFDRLLIAYMKKTAYLLNFSRAELAVSYDVVEALDDGRLAGYVTDFPDESLLACKKALCIPHLGASTPEAEENCAMVASHQLRAYLLEGNIQNSVNMPECVLARSSGCRLTVFHQNIPNSVGQITSKLASDGINIANMINKSRDAIAYTVLDLDQCPSDELINGLYKLEGIGRVRLITD